MTKAQVKRTTHPLEQLRLDRDWSYAQLGRAIYAITRVQRSEAAWSRICQLATTPRSRTQYAIDLFLAAQSNGQGASR